MKKFLSLAVVFLLSCAASFAQAWSAKLGSDEGLPGTEVITTSGFCIKFTSSKFDLGSQTTDKVRITVLDTRTHEQPNGNNYCFAMSELKIYDANGVSLSYKASSNADHNSLATTTDGQGLSALSDNNYSTYFHSMWQGGANAVTDYHYVELQLTKSVSAFSLEWTTRVGEPKNAPTEVAITLGTDYEFLGEEFELGSAVTTSDALAQGNRLFVLKSNAYKSYTAADGAYYSGSGPIYMQGPQSGSTSPSIDNVMQLIPIGNGAYYVYWPVAGVFLENSAYEYNGKNGWQYATSNIDKAAEVVFEPISSHYFEMSYTATYKAENNGVITTVTAPLYVGGELRDNVVSKTKIFAADKKVALESGNYTAGYSLPVAFNWSIYEASLSDETVASLSMSVQQIAEMKFATPLSSARAYIEQYGDFNGTATDAKASLEAAVSAAEALLGTGQSLSIAQVRETEEALVRATAKYVASKLDVYNARVDSILSAVEFSSYPYAAGTYPESSRDLLTLVKSNIAAAKAKSDTYTPAQYEALFVQIEDDIKNFYGYKITIVTLPVTYGAEDGLPGTLENFGGYVWSSPLVSLNDAVSTVRITFDAGIGNGSWEMYNGFPIISLSELELFDAAGNSVPLAASNFSTNSQELSEGPIADICDGSVNTYWHSIWQNGTMDPVGSVYIEIALPTPMSQFSLKLSGRNNGSLFPSQITIDTTASAEEEGGAGEDGAGDLYVYLADGGIDAYPLDNIDGETYVEGDFLCLPLKTGSVVYYTSQEYDSVSVVAPKLPEFTSYKFNNKYNPNLNVDVEAQAITPVMNFNVNSIGHWLTASFQMSDDNAVAYIDTVLQESKVSRRSFKDPVTYIVTYPGYRRISGRVKVKDEVWRTEGSEITEIPLTASMLSTNKPSTNSSEGLGNLLDGDPNTIFHSTWGSANDATVNVNAYIDVELPDAVSCIKLYYRCRPQTNYAPKTLEIYAGDDSGSLTLVRTLTHTDDSMPTGVASAEYTSPEISLNGNYSYLRILQTAGEYSKNHMALSEMRIYDVVPGDSVLVSEAEYAERTMPFGREYKVKVNWLVDNAVSLPRIDIDIENGREVTSKDYYLEANFRITGFGTYDNFEDSVQIKGRGNTSWTSTGKKPYRLKFAEKVKPFGLTKGKSWVLLANRQPNSMMANAAAMKIGQMVGAEYTNHIIPVDLYVNGTYRGNYMFTEKVGMANNSVDVDEEEGYLLELDSYFDETYKFESKYSALPVNIKEPDLSEYTTTAATARKALIAKEFNALDSIVHKGGKIDNVLDVDACARFMLVNELVCNQEIGHPKSTFLFKELAGDPSSKIKLGPLWDFDWAFGYETTGDYCVSDYTASVFNEDMEDEPGYRFFRYLMGFTAVKKYYYKNWVDFINNKCLDELVDYLDSYYKFAKNSFVNDYNAWPSYGTDDYYTVNENMKSWISDRAKYLRNNVTTSNIDDILYPYAGDVNNNNLITVHDIAMTTAYNNDNVHPSFKKKKADIDGDGQVTANDVLAIESAVADADPLTAMQMYLTPLGIGDLWANDFELMIDEDCELPLQIARYDGENYKAVQMDVTVPDGVEIYDVVAAGALTDHTVSLAQRSMTDYRIIVYSNGDEAFASGDDAVVTLVLNTPVVIAEDSREIKITNVLAVDEDTNELRLRNTVAKFGISTNIYDTAAPTASVVGGECITITSLVAQNVKIYSVDGRLVRSVNVGVGTTRVELPAGVYVTMGTKVVVK